MAELQNDYVEVPQSGRGVAGYRCKIYKTLLDITSESDYTKRPLVDRSGRWMTKNERGPKPASTRMRPDSSQVVVTGFSPRSIT